jgi:hypothetical protein
MNGTLNKVLIGYLGEDVKCIILMRKLYWSDWLQTKSISTNYNEKYHQQSGIT